MQDFSVSSALLFSSLQRGRCGSFRLMLIWQMCFCLARNWALAICPAFSPSSWHSRMPKGHHSKTSVPPSTWQRECCTDGCRAAVRSLAAGLIQPGPLPPTAKQMLWRWRSVHRWVAACHSTSMIFVH